VQLAQAEFEGIGEDLNQRLGRRGWRFRVAADGVRGRTQSWPSQLESLLDPGSDDRLPALGLVLDFRAMPLGGERFRDVLNGERESLLRGFGAFRVRQLRRDGSWAPEIGHRAFMHGYGTGTAISRQTDVVIFDRGPSERGEKLVERFVTEVARFMETGGALAALLQRLYRRTVLNAIVPEAPLPETVGASSSMVEELAPSAGFLPVEAGHHWRR
jgi:hypothetical protein